MHNENRIRSKITNPRYKKVRVSRTRVKTNSKHKRSGVAVTVTSSGFLLQILSFILCCCFIRYLCRHVVSLASAIVCSGSCSSLWVIILLGWTWSSPINGFWIPSQWWSWKCRGCCSCWKCWWCWIVPLEWTITYRVIPRSTYQA